MLCMLSFVTVFSLAKPKLFPCYGRFGFVLKVVEGNSRCHNWIPKIFPISMRLLTYSSKKPELGNTIHAHFSAEQIPNIPIPSKHHLPPRLKETTVLLLLWTYLGTRRASKVLGGSRGMFQAPEGHVASLSWRTGRVLHCETWRRPPAAQGWIPSLVLEGLYSAVFIV